MKILTYSFSTRVSYKESFELIFNNTEFKQKFVFIFFLKKKKKPIKFFVCLNKIRFHEKKGDQDISIMDWIPLDDNGKSILFFFKKNRLKIKIPFLAGQRLCCFTLVERDSSGVAKDETKCLEKQHYLVIKL